MPPEKNATYWQSASRRLALLVNLGWWLETWLHWVMASALLGSVAVVFVRWMPWWPLSWVWGVLASLAALGGFAAWLSVRRRFEGIAAARIRLEDSLGLKTRLTAAAAGVGPWPAPPAHLVWPVRWQWPRALAMVAAAGLLLGLAAWVPVQARTDAKKRVIEKPSAVKDVEQWVASLRQESAVEEKSLEEVEKKISELLQRPAENWYEHGSLEAAGNLKEQTSEMLRELSENLVDAERAAAALQAAGDAFPQEARDAVEGELAKAAEGLRTGGIKPGEQLLEQLQRLADSQGLGQLTREQLEELTEQLQSNARALQEALENAPELKLSGGTSGERGRKPGEGEGEGAGQGGVDRGPGTAPLTLKENETGLDTRKKEGLTSQLDLSRVAPGDVVGVQDGRHDVNPKGYTGPSQGGAVQDVGGGGAAVWQNSLLPGEREALKRYFK